MDTNIKTQEADLWIEEVRTELECVKNVLKQTREILEHDPDDDIWFEFERIVNKLDNYWNGLVKGYEKTCGIIKDVINEAEKVGQEIVDMVKDSVNKMFG